MNNRVNLREDRDFSEKLNATFTFVRQNYKSLGLTMLLFGLPLMVIGMIFLQYMQMGMQQQIIDNGSPFTIDYFVNFFISFLLLMFAYLWLAILSISYIAEYLNENLNITPGQVFQRAFSKLGSVIVASIITTIMTLIASVFLFIPGIYVGVALSLVIIVIIIEGDPTFEAISRSFSLIKGKWWSTFGLLIVMSIIVGIMQFVFNIPTYVVTFIRAFHQDFFTFDAINIITTIFSTIGLTLLYPLIFIALTFQYFNLVELKESEGLKREIERAGKQSTISPGNEGDF
ncbi:MAG: hypothetical protein AB9834_21020 [Lentimicrobium sp.]